MTLKHLLVIDDERNVAYSIKRAIESEDVLVDTVQSGIEALRLFQKKSYSIVIVDLRLPDTTGLELLRQFKAIDSSVPVIVMTAYSAAETAIEAIKDGAFDYLVKPVDIVVLDQVVGRALAHASAGAPESGAPAEPTLAEKMFVGQSTPMQAVYKLIGKFSRESLPVLILGESGTGKELAAVSIHRHSLRSAGPFVAINCAAIPENLLESELFGHEKGAFTSADRQRIGKFEQAHGGTIFLDEIGEMSPRTQAKMLRLIQEQKFERVGGTITIDTDVRIVAATNRDIDQMVIEGVFRKDLLYRLNCLTIRMPALRERTGDIRDLAMQFIAAYNAKNPTRKRVLHASTMIVLERYAWPGNVRELQNAINFSAINSCTPVILPDSLPVAVGLIDDAHFSLLDPPEALAGLVLGLIRDGKGDIYRRLTAICEKTMIREVMASCSWNQVQASELLGISRTTLRAKIASLNIELKG